VLIESPPPGATADEAAEVLAGPIYSGDSLVCEIVFVRGRAAPAFRSGEMLLVDSLTTFCGDLIRSRRLLRELRLMSVAMVRALVNAVDQKDEYTCGHSLRVAFYSDMLGRRLNLAPADLQMLQWSALLHDVGKIGIRDSVLKKEGKLTDDEFEHIREHPVRSYRIVQEIPQLARALDGILYHHERYDGSGYPTGLAGDRIPLQARIIQIGDVFDALTSNRSYRRAYSWKAALEIMARDAGKAIDPDLQALFEALIRHELSGATDAWDRLTRRANQFTPSITEEEGET
jgi:HD-GYP domain-containing protein (c-di-GMP phosphodiesterase class II)